MQVLTTAQRAVISGILDVASGRSTSVPMWTYLWNVIPKEEPCGAEIAAFLRKAYSDVQQRADHIKALRGADGLQRYLLEGVYTILGEDKLSGNVSLSSLDRDAARAEFDELGRQMRAAMSREEMVRLGQRRAELAPFTGEHYAYENHCWSCKGRISSMIHARCPTCGWYMCSCGACEYGSFGH